MKTKKLLVIGGSYLQLPAIIKAKELGLEVAVADYDPNAIGISYADKYFNVSTIDEDGVCLAVEEFRPNGIITLATDMPIRAIAKACEKFNLKGISYDAANKSTNKEAMIKALKKNNVSHPWFYTINKLQDIYNIKNQLKFPCVSKPIDNSGSRGVTIVKNEDNLESALNYSLSHSRGSGVIIEEFMEGDEVSVEVLVEDGNPYILAVTDKTTTGEPHFVEIQHSQPSMLSDKDLSDIKHLAIDAILALGIDNGPAHVEIMLTNEGPKIIEVGARLGGDFITSHLVPLSTGIDMTSEYIKMACGEEVNLAPRFNKASAIKYITAEEGMIRKISNLDTLKKFNGVKEIAMLKKTGEKSTKIKNSHDRLGYVISQSNDVVEAIKTCEQIINKINIDISNVEEYENHV
ncbi:ATP-grasp domain-containing protein [Halobacillus sp. KGW1]|uniref:ATP-grasp domain-containing protein n=1 Tax=Halobacillus sp. KGW1 TaxID=1793726 RepID=UPI00078211D0|nr:ATP-grasp domain-containing protein [Halobacillus sp. KGW1]